MRSQASPEKHDASGLSRGLRAELGHLESLGVSVDKTERKEIYVAMFDGAGNPIPVGRLAFSEVRTSDGQIRIRDVSFTYMSQYSGPALDPVNLNYVADGIRKFELPSALQDSGLFRVLSDALPGEWGKNQVYREYPETKKMSDMQLLAWMASGKATKEGQQQVAAGAKVGTSSPAAARGCASGALFFFTKEPGDERPLTGLQQVDEVRVKSLRELAGLAVKMTEHELAASIVHGGARPKTTYYDAAGEVGKPKTHYIVKFNADRDTFNGARIEHATLELAKMAGINTTRTRVVRILREGKPVADMFLTERYDRNTDSKGADVRHHRVSLLALLDPVKVPTQERGDYSDLFSAVRRVSAQPEEDAVELFRRMLFNIAVNNTDDHLKNHELVYMGAEEGWRLGPAFDPTPTPFPYPHKTSIVGLTNGSLKDDFVLMAAKKLQIRPEVALELRNEVAKAVVEWRPLFEQCGVEATDMAFMQKAIDQCGVRAEKHLGFGANLPDPIRAARSINPEQPIEGPKESAFELRITSPDQASKVNRTKR